MNKYKSKLPRDDLKRFAKEVSLALPYIGSFPKTSTQVADKLANSDFKSGRVDDPTKIDEKHEKKVKKYCKEFFDKAAYKHRKLENEKAARKQKAERSKSNGIATVEATSPVLNLDASPDIKREGDSNDEDVKMSEDEDDEPTPPSPSANVLNGDGLKRKRDEDDEDDVKADSDISKSPAKRIKSESPPPPPPEPPVDTPPMQSEDVSPVEMSNQLHADTSFAEKSMADVLAEAQQDSGDGGDHADVSMDDANANFVDHVKETTDSPESSEVIKHETYSSHQFPNGQSPRLKPERREIKAES